MFGKELRALPPRTFSFISTLSNRTRPALLALILLMLLLVPHRVKTGTPSPAFRVAAPIIWNNLPDFVKLADSPNFFKRRLKCLLFDAAF